MRYTEYHAGKAVIKDKRLLPEAMEKLAKMEDIEEESNDMNKITTEMMEYICNHICKHPEKCIGETDLMDICCGCKMGKFVCDILNRYNRLNDFEQSQTAKLMEQNQKLEERDTAKEPNEVDEEYHYFKCPSCGMSIYASDDLESHKFCLNCGQRLKWED